MYQQAVPLSLFLIFTTIISEYVYECGCECGNLSEVHLLTLLQHYSQAFVTSCTGSNSCRVLARKIETIDSLSCSCEDTHARWWRTGVIVVSLYIPNILYLTSFFSNKFDERITSFFFYFILFYLACGGNQCNLTFHQELSVCLLDVGSVGQCDVRVFSITDFTYLLDLWDCVDKDGEF